MLLSPELLLLYPGGRAAIKTSFASSELTYQLQGTDALATISADGVVSAGERLGRATVVVSTRDKSQWLATRVEVRRLFASTDACTSYSAWGRWPCTKKSDLAELSKEARCASASVWLSVTPSVSKPAVSGMWRPSL